MPRFAPSAFVIVLLLAACSPEAPNHDDAANQPPTVWVTAEQPVESGDSYSVAFTWGGRDPDGSILHYEYIVTDNEDGYFDPNDLNRTWTSVSGTSATLTFPLEHTNDGGIEAAAIEPSRTLVVRAVDNEFVPSEEPDHLTFTSKSLAPAVRITTPPANLGITPADVPPVSTFTWDTDPGKMEPDSVQWALVSTIPFGNSYAQTINYLRTVLDAPEWGPWTWFDNPSGKGREWTTPTMDYGDYVFAVRAKNVVGLTNYVLTEPVNVRRVKVQARESGPTLTVLNGYFGRVISASCDYPLTIVDFGAGLPASFTLSACAEAYGGTIAGYRYGWDMLDPSDPEQWEIDLTPLPSPSVTLPPRAFAFGTHVLTVEAVDNSGYCSRVQVKLNIVRFTGERNLLVLDDFRADEVAGQSGWDVTNGGMPSDAEHDAFWLDMVSRVDQFDPAIDMVSATNQFIPITTLARYRSVVWSVFSYIEMRTQSDLPYLYDFIQYRDALLLNNFACFPAGGVQGEVVPDGLAMIMQSGVHVLITGHQPVQNVVPRVGTFGVRYPVIPLYELETGAVQTGTGPTYLAERPGLRAFAYRDLCLDAIDYGFQTNQRLRVTGTGNNRRYCGLTGVRVPNANSRRDDTMRGAVPLDPNFPSISLRPEAAAPGRLYQESSQGYDVEVYNPAYFRRGASCEFVWPPRSCFEPIYGLVSLDTAELTYQQPVAFWTSANADVVADFPGAVAARSAVFGFPPVFFNPSEIKPAIEYILFDEWQLPRNPLAEVSR